MGEDGRSCDEPHHHQLWKTSHIRRTGGWVGVGGEGLLKTVVTHNLCCFSGTCQLEQAWPAGFPDTRSKDQFDQFQVIRAEMIVWNRISSRRREEAPTHQVWVAIRWLGLRLFTTRGPSFPSHTEPSSYNWPPKREIMITETFEEHRCFLSVLSPIFLIYRVGS